MTKVFPIRVALRWQPIRIVVASLTLSALASCGGGGGNDAPPTILATPLVWDQGQATWDNVVWQ